MPNKNAPITPEQAQDLLQYLINQLQINGFGIIVSEINNKINEQIEEDSNPNQLDNPIQISTQLANPINQLIFFIDEAIDSLRYISNDNFSNIIDNFNEYIISDQGKVETIQVELLSSESKPILYDLRQLPTYSNLIDILQQIQKEIITG